MAVKRFFARAWKRLHTNMTNTRMIALSFLGVILLGAFLLCLPFSSRSFQWTNPIDALFTATTSTCVTGLVVVETGSYWSTFGQIVILIMIQIGGLGFMTLMTLVSYFLHGKVSLHERRLLVESTGAMHLGGVMGTFRQILLGTFVIEGLGAVLLYRYFSLNLFPGETLKNIWYAVFISISSFCNAGIDIFGKGNSLCDYVGDPYVNFVVMFLIVMGGLGFLVWNDVLKNFFRPKKLQLHSKIVLSVTAILLFGGAFLLYLTDRNAAFAGLSEPQKLMAALFQSVTTRTAGAVTVDQSTISDSGALISMILMFIGGSPGSTAGGIKTTTAVVVLLSTIGLARNKPDIVLFKRRIDPAIVRQAGAVVFVYLSAVLVATIAICALEPAGLREVFYEVISAICTVGLSMNLTGSLCGLSKLILILLMYTGRLGGLSLFLALGETREPPTVQRPVEKILIG